LTRSNTRIRHARVEDAGAMVEIMKANHHYYTPAVDGMEAIARQLEMENNMLLVAEIGEEVVGFLNGAWDGARAFIFKLSVKPEWQGRGIGTALVRESARLFMRMGAPTLGVAAADGSGGEANDSVGFWKAIGFESIPARLMIHFDIDELGRGENEGE
jgi:ribosomal protein S18 acetylase RimI-like enzyme